MHKQKVLFVCLGNICRSPAAEGVFKHLIERENISESFFVDSAGTSAHHVGERADSRMRNAASNRGLELTSISRQFISEDFKRFDYIVVMDDSNYQNVLTLDYGHEYEHKIYKMADYASGKFESFKSVPDPYYGGADGFDLVLDLLENSCKNFLNEIHK